jgi:spore germination cell wall hydrolase CwlJ-like protein
MQRVSTHLLKLLLILAMTFGLSSCDVIEHAQKTQPAPVVARAVDSKQLQCLAENIYYEAGKESTEGKAAVARVVMNRVHHGFASTPCKVIYQTTAVKQTNEDDESFFVKMCQFSWVCEGKGNPNKRDPRYQSSLQVAYNVLAYDAYKEVLPNTALFFHNTSVKPNWPHNVIKQIGNHIFYSKTRKHKTRYK